MAKDQRFQREEFLDPQWQRVRLRIFERDGWSCVACGEASRTLHVHHLRYEAGKEPWESPPDALATLCETCHRYLSPKATSSLVTKLGITTEQVWEAASRVEDALADWTEQRRKMAAAALVTRTPSRFVSSCPNWRKTRTRAGRVWTPDEDEALLLEFDAGLPLESIALLRQRGVFGVAVRLYKLGRNPPEPSPTEFQPNSEPGYKVAYHRRRHR